MSELLNRTIGGYQLLEPIGGGGVAEVYRARQTTGGAREVAIKVIFPEFARQPGVAANFAQIARAAAQLANHPHILPVISTGEDHEYLYLVTPFVKEGTLADWMEKGGRLGASDVGPFFQQLCGAVSYAHSLGLTHGNIKPRNVYLFEGRHVLLGDFGLLWDVRALDPSWSGSDVAAFEYLAPEVFDGRMSPSGDIYSLGATLFATLTGHAPFQTKRLGELITAARQQTPPSLAQEKLTSPIIALDAVVRQAMAKQVEQRYPSAAVLGQAIEATLRQAAQAAPVAAPMPASAGQQPWEQPWGPSAPPPVPAGGFAPQARLDPPFPPLPPMAESVPMIDPRGGPAIAPVAGAGFAEPVDGPTMRVAAPQLETPVVRLPAPSSELVDGPTMHVAAPAPDSRFDMGYEPEPPASRWGQGGRGEGTPLPLAQTPQAAPETPLGAQSGQFSATELGLPRLTNPALGNLPPDWRELITDESARRRHDPFAMSESSLASLSAIAPYDDSRVDLDAMARSQAGIGQNERVIVTWEPSDDGQNWDASSDRQAWEAPEQGAVAVAGRRGAHADYDIERMTDGRPPMRRSARADKAHDTLQSQKVWTNSRTIVRGKPRPKAPFFTIVALVALTALELAGLAVARPDICVTHACSMVAAYAHRMAPGLRIPGITAPVHLTPVVPQVSVIAEGSSQITFTLSNSSADPITWRATPSLAWMTVSPASGSLKGGAGAPLTVTVKPHGVAPGVYTGALAVYVGDGMSEEPVVVTVKPGAELAVSQHVMTFSHCGEAQSLSLSNPGAAKLTFTALPSQADALSVSPNGGSLAPGATMALSVTISCSAATGATYAVIIVSNGGSAQINVSYT